MNAGCYGRIIQFFMLFQLPCLISGGQLWPHLACVYTGEHLLFCHATGS